MEAKRIEIAALLRASHKTAEIVRVLNVGLMTVHRVAKRLEKSESLKDCHRVGRPRVVKTAAIKKALKCDPTMKMKQLAKKKWIWVSTVSRAVKQEGGKSLKMIRKPL